MHSRASHSVLSKREVIRNRLGNEAEGYGIDRRRIVFAARLPKSKHLSRHAAADLFVDTLIYGAHSTATDALAGGLPVLTLAGACAPLRDVQALGEECCKRGVMEVREAVGTPCHLQLLVFTPELYLRALRGSEIPQP